MRANTGEQLREVAAALKQDQRNYLHEVMQGKARIAELEAELAALKSQKPVPNVHITDHLDEIDAPVWEFINAEARKLGPITGSIDNYGLSRPNGGQPNGGVAVLWNGPKIHAVALTVRDARNRTRCIRLLNAHPPAAQANAELVEALRLAANRLDRLTLEVSGGYWRSCAAEWTGEARAALAKKELSE